MLADGNKKKYLLLCISPHINPEQQVIQQEQSESQCSKICTGLQHLVVPQTSTYHIIPSMQAHSASNDILPTPKFNILPDPECIDHVPFEALQASECEGEWKEHVQSWNTTDMTWGPFCNYGFSIQETFYQPDKQELVLSCPITQICSHNTTKNTHYKHTNPNAFERAELYIKPFTSLVPE